MKRKEGQPHKGWKKAVTYSKVKYSKYTLGHTEPQEGKQMNEIIDKVAEVTDGVEVKHFALALDKDGKEIRVEITPTGEFSQDVEDKPEPTPTLH